MVENGYITRADGEKAKKEPLTVTPRPTGAHIFAAEYFAEEVRRDIYDRYGEKKLYEGGLSVRTTLDPKMQVHGAQGADRRARAIRRGARLARRRSSKIDIAGDWGAEARRGARRWPTSRRGGSRWCSRAATRPRASACSPAREPGGARREGARDRHHPARGREMGEARERPDRATRRPRSQVLEAGDVVYVEPLPTRTGQFRLRQVPEISGAHGRDGPVYRPRARDGRRLLVRPERVQPRDPGAAPAGLLVQAVRLCGGARQRLHALDRS